MLFHIPFMLELHLNEGIYFKFVVADCWTYEKDDGGEQSEWVCMREWEGAMKDIIYESNIFPQWFKRKTAKYK